MAYAVLGSLIQTIPRILNDDQNYPISATGKQQIESHRGKAIRLRDFLEKFPKEATSLETRMRDAANEAEDVMEHFMYEHIQSHHKSITASAADILYDFGELKFVMEEINSLTEEVAVIFSKQEKKKVAVIKTERVEIGGRPAMQSAPISSTQMDAPLFDTFTAGLDKKMKEIKGVLFDGELRQRQIIPITGIAGIGKTTLARTVYDDLEVIEKFPVRAWITVTQTYNLENIFEDLLSSLEKVVEDGLFDSSDSTEDKLHKILTMKKHLIVVDDLWSTKAWDDINKAFGDPKKLNGSRIMITTRDTTVASHANTNMPPRNMDFMDDHNSWVLLKQKVFPNRGCPSDLEKIGKDIARCCGGQPLAIVQVAQILSTISETISSWEEVAADVHLHTQKDGQFQEMMALSYTYLPLHLRPCLLYIGRFQEESEIRVPMIIQSWITQGYVKSEKEAEGYLDDLVRRNLVTVTTNKSNGKVKTCHLLSSVRDMCEKVAFDESYERGPSEHGILNEEFNSIAEEVAIMETERVQLSDHPAVLPPPSSSRPTPPTPALDSFTVGLEEDLNKIKGLVCEGAPERRIIPITGMAGIGKTTLAAMVYNDPLVMETFPVRAWITVSQDFKIDTIFADLLDSLQKGVQEGLVESSDSVRNKIYKILTVNRYLIILDDVWSEKACNDIKRVLGNPYEENGSRIMITTRITSVAFYINWTRPLDHLMQLLKPEQSWNLLKQKMFPSKECPPPLVKAGKDIANACLGLPLAIVAIARVLLTVSETQPAWEEVAKKVRPLIQKDVEFRRIMSLSYIDLPHYLRPCFLYMGGFPEDNEIRVSKLTQLWMAEGFVEHEKEAERHLLSLVDKNLASVMTTKSNGKTKCCDVHGFIRDMSKTVAVDDNYERRTSIAHPDLRCVAKGYASTLRSVICFKPTESSLLGLRKLRLLRVLDVVDTDAYSLPPQVFDLFQLRYLSFSFAMIPAAIFRLQNLRTLIIPPRKRLRRLRHSSMDEVYIPEGEGEGAASAVENQLTVFVVKKPMICTEEMMRLISNVKKLALTYFGDKYQQDYQLHNLVLLHQLEKLKLVVKKGQLKATPVFPRTLRKLTLSGWRFPWGDMKGIGSLPNLQKLILRDHAFEGRLWDTYDYEEAGEGIDEEAREESDEWIDAKQFPKLKYLLIDKSDLENWVTERDHFPELRHLVLSGCDKLSEIPYDIGEIATLELIEVDHTNISLLECDRQIQKEQMEEYGNYLLQVRAL